MKVFLKQFFSLLDQEARKKLPFLIITFLIAPLLDIVGIGMTGVFLTLISSPDYFLKIFPFNKQLLVNLNHTQLIAITGIFVILSFLIKAFAGYFIQRNTSAFSFRLALRLKLRLMKAYQFAPYSFHLMRNSSYLLNRMIQADGYIGGILLPSLTFFSNLLIGLTILGFLLFMHPYATVGLCIIFGFVFWLNSKLFWHRAKKLGQVTSASGGEIFKIIKQTLYGLKEIRVLGTEQYFFNKLQLIAKDFADAQGVYNAFQLIPRYIVESVLMIFVILLCLVNIAIGMTPGEIVIFVGVFAAAGARLLPTMSQLTTGLNQIRFSYPTMTCVYQELCTLKNLENEFIPPACQEKLVFSKIQFNQACYRYPGSKQDAVSNINLSIIKGQSVGLIGTSGAGKSTLVNILLGLLPIQSAEILIDGQPITNIRKWLNNFAYIPQQIFLLDDTLKHNITLGIEDDQIDEEKIKTVLHMARLDQVVLDLPDGVNTLIGENGIRLSGGQRQRVALARAFYHERDVIVMDEATSSLDNETEQEVINSIQTLRGIKTLIVIAHRMSTIRHCNVIYKLEAGRVIANGSYEEVVELKKKEEIELYDNVGLPLHQ
ncbi:MAG TPA: ABC transporter ATP-binding protein [Gammaproteobacteria bacterium]|nr:MAG: hypothetical protein A3E83_06640 [Gammaproteobacteria bacterium RIFCSPHIGHO2_12_FULL_41_20]HLB43565.1 ABC transporter ATP-binding protein [Gammaproteobacteria bacterium]